MGALLAVTFFGVLILIFSPIFPGQKNGLDYSDDLFNKLSKGSSYFIPEIGKAAQKYAGSNIAVSVKLDKPADVEKAIKMFITAGLQVGATDSQLKISGDLGALLAQVLKDSDAMYHNNGKVVAETYGYSEKEVMTLWWTVLNKMDKELKKAKKVDESNMISTVLKKGVEPAFNYYGVEAQSVSEKAFVMTALLIFYVAYTMWWGYAIFFLFDGIGLSMKKAKVKKEV
jgi:hypothetical protein